MKAYRLEIWKRVADPTTGEFMWNVSRTKTVHAHNKKAAVEKVELKDGEWIYRAECLGIVRKIVETRFEYIPIKHKKYEDF